MTSTRAAIYTRISRDIANEGLGVERQREDCEALAERMGFTVAGIYTDNDISAYSRKKRPDYERMLQAIERGRIDAVLVLRIDRLYRRMTELERYITICDPRSVPTFTVRSGNLDLTTANGRMVARLLGATAQGESELKSERISRQKAQAAKQSKYLGGRVPIGWKVEDGEVVVDEKKAKHIRKGTAMLISGLPVAEITQTWAEDGMKSLSDKNLNTTQVSRILMRSRNAGLVTHRGEVVADGWPPIVPLEDFRRAEAILNDPARKQDSPHKRKYLLSGILRCHCGRRVTGFMDNRGVGAYRCSVHQEGAKYVRGHCQRKMAPIDAFVLGRVADYLGREDVKNALVATFDELAEESFTVAPDGALKALLDRKNALVRLFAQGAITESQLVEGSAEVQGKLDGMEREASSRTGSTALAGMLIREDPAKAFMDAPVLLQREVIGSLFEIHLVPRSRKGQVGVDPESIVFYPK
ncbi:recombinase family protein [Arthrobacter rhombi]|uniref:recombinase family protein n=1 Tax=Arthrobacter rhombi TaxID=71253 RepID=UPI003FD68618